MVSRTLNQAWSRGLDIGFCFVFGATAPGGPQPPHSRDFYITQNKTPQSVGRL
jgi:hypothetical protein